MISFSSISLVFKKFQKPSNLITYLITSSFKITKKIIQTAKSNHFIGHDTFFCTPNTSLFNALCIVIHQLILKLLFGLKFVMFVPLDLSSSKHIYLIPFPYPPTCT